MHSLPVPELVEESAVVDGQYMYGIDERSIDVLSNTRQMSRNEDFWTYDTKQSTYANFETHNCNCCLIVIFSKPRSIVRFGQMLIQNFTLSIHYQVF